MRKRWEVVCIPKNEDNSRYYFWFKANAKYLCNQRNFMAKQYGLDIRHYYRKIAHRR